METAKAAHAKVCALCAFQVDQRAHITPHTESEDEPLIGAHRPHHRRASESWRCAAASLALLAGAIILLWHRAPRDKAMAGFSTARFQGPAGPASVDAPPVAITAPVPSSTSCSASSRRSPASSAVSWLAASREGHCGTTSGPGDCAGAPSLVSQGRTLTLTLTLTLHPNPNPTHNPNSSLVSQGRGTCRVPSAVVD